MNFNKISALLVTIGAMAGCGHTETATMPPPSMEAPVIMEPPAVHLVTMEKSSNTARPVNPFGEVEGFARPVTGISGDSAFIQRSMADEGYDADVKIDPTGKWMVFSSTRHSERPDIYLQRVDGTAVIQLTNDPADDVQPCFSPDGKTLTFASNRHGNWDIYQMDIEGKNVRQLTSGPGQKMSPSFNPTGSKIVYCALSGKSDQWELWVMNLQSQQKTMIGNGLFPAWSPRTDVNRIAFQKARQRGSRWFSIWTVDLVDDEPRMLTEVATASNSALVCPTWNAEGTRLAFSTVLTDGKGGQDIWVINADGSGRKRMTEGSGVNVSPFWNKETIYFISDRGGHENIWSLSADTTPSAVPATVAEAPTKAVSTPPADKTPAKVAETASHASPAAQTVHEAASAGHSTPSPTVHGTTGGAGSGEKIHGDLLGTTDTK